MLGCVLASVVLAGCASSAMPSGAVVTYSYRDASVPPQFHRSVTLTVTQDASRILIDSYGEVLAERTVPTPAAVWAALGQSLDDVKAVRPSEPPAGCTGGTGRTVTVVAGSQTLADVSAEFCGGSNAGVDSTVDAWIQPARELFPPTEDLAPASDD